MNHKKVIITIFEAVIVSFVVLQSLLILISAMMDYKCFAVSSNSMSPYLKSGDMVIVKPVEFNDIHVGDVLTFSNIKSNDFFTHRVVELNNEKQWIYTKGDANSVKDPTPTSCDYVVGKVVWSLKGLGYIHMALDSVYLILIVAVMIIIILLNKIYFLRKRVKDEQT